MCCRRSWTIQGKLDVSCDELRTLFGAIRARLGAASVQQFLLWPEVAAATSCAKESQKGSAELRKLLDEARDMLER